ncbi:MAG: NUDIX pyrophosphatase [Candidatus Celaenobacter antarcticus]|nr:NUDIX pyrophosphatase [Candidatus Celaenobacter antarcticus]
MRAEFQILVIPYKIVTGKAKFVIFKRKDMCVWQFIAGGGEFSETPIEAAKRETFEESGIKKSPFFKLDTVTMIPVSCFKDHQNKPGLYVIPEYCFAVELSTIEINLSNEHSEYLLVDYDTAIEHIRYDSNKTAIWELNERIKNDDLNAPEFIA